MLHNQSAGVSNREPIVSPSHQVNQIGPKSLASMKPPMKRLATPMVALTTVLSIAAKKQKLERVAGAVKNSATVSAAIDKIRADQALERVSHCDTQ